MDHEIIQFFEKQVSQFGFKTLKTGQSVNLSNVKDGLKGFLSLLLSEQLKMRVLLIEPTDGEAERRSRKMATWDAGHVLYFPAKPVHDYFTDAHSSEITAQRMAALDRLLRGRSRDIVVTSIEALMEKMPPAADFKKNILTLKKGQELDPLLLSRQLADMGYEESDPVEARGQFSRRGEIVDCFPMNAQQAVRVDFFDEEIESLSFFDRDSQRSSGETDRAVILPVSETVFSREKQQALCDKIFKKYGGDPGCAERIELLSAAPSAYPEVLSAFDDGRSEGHFSQYLGKNWAVFWDDKTRCEEHAEAFLEKTFQDFENLIDEKIMFPEEQDKFYDFKACAGFLTGRPEVNATLFSSGASETEIDCRSKSVESFAGRLPVFADYVTQHIEDGDRVVICCPDKKGKSQIKEVLNQYGITAFSDGQTPGICLVRGDISEGFELPGARLVFLRQSEILKTEKKRRRRRKMANARKIDSFTSLSIGDYVVHDVHGIGIYQGIQKMTFGDVTKDMMVIAYHGDDKLYLPVEQMNAIQAYIGTGGDRMPKVNTLGRPDWSRTKSKAKKAVEEMADDLIALYAKRRSTPGFAFSADTPWQKEFEDRFPYEETDDQLQCIEEIKQDMEKPVPMDRLLCGDVGYGKTEVALRAAFKAIMDNKQVAFLAPTTILAQQHYQTMKERFKGFPIAVEVLSRFRTPKQQKQIVKDLKTGRIDMIVGTHRLLSKDVAFKDLGLLIVDEEQRFGVKSKEKLKSFKANVDTLTLSATPIPRTLHMSMTGIRDMSILSEPPAGRRPVRTYVLRKNPVVLEDAIEQEMSRGGQVFFVHNRIKDIQEVAGRLSQMVPEARIAVAHGRMSAETIEGIMSRFLNRDFDVLVTTAIVESGLDIKNANTMIVDDGDKMGLSQLYQLRGRVGRSSRQSYCYILYDRQVLSEVAQKRLKAIKDFTAFGSGFKIAMRDMEIRGAGNILGAAQSGHMFNIGYEMYCRILEETMAEHLGKPVEKRQAEPVKIAMNIDAYIPEKYIANEMVKYDMYKKISTISDEADAQMVEDELTDRFGALPGAVKNLLTLSLMSSLAGQHQITEIQERGDKIYLLFDEKTQLSLPGGGVIQKMLDQFDIKFKGDPRRDNVWSIGVKGQNGKKRCETVIKFLKMWNEAEKV
jgi:transcription-repair coupling factor (superfamily II helicase)